MEQRPPRMRNYSLRTEIKKALSDLRIVRYTMLMNSINHEKIDKVIKMLEEIYDEIKNNIDLTKMNTYVNLYLEAKS